jgi:hypothetical protein
LPGSSDPPLVCCLRVRGVRGLHGLHEPQYSRQPPMHLALQHHQSTRIYMYIIQYISVPILAQDCLFRSSLTQSLSHILAMMDPSVLLSRVACCPELVVPNIVFFQGSSRGCVFPIGAICGQLSNGKRMLSRVACCPELVVPNIVFFQCSSNHDLQLLRMPLLGAGRMASEVEPGQAHPSLGHRGAPF